MSSTSGLTRGLSVEATGVQLRVPPEYSTGETRNADGSLENDAVHWNDQLAGDAEPPNQRGAGVPGRHPATGGEPTLLRKTGTSDMNVYAKTWDCPMVTYGPGDSDLDHAPNEHLPLDEYDRSVAVLETATERLLED